MNFYSFHVYEKDFLTDVIISHSFFYIPQTPEDVFRFTSKTFKVHRSLPTYKLYKPLCLPRNFICKIVMSLKIQGIVSCSR